MKKADLNKLSLEQLIGTEGRVLSKSSSVNAFLNKQYKMPASMNDLEKWVVKQYSGVANADYVKELVAEITKRDVKAEVKKVIVELEAHVLTPAQQKLIPDAILGYQNFLESGIKRSKKVLEIVEIVNAKVGDFTEAKVVTPKPKVETTKERKSSRTIGVMYEKRL